MAISWTSQRRKKCWDKGKEEGAQALTSAFSWNRWPYTSEVASTSAAGHAATHYWRCKATTTQSTASCQTPLYSTGSSHTENSSWTGGKVIPLKTLQVAISPLSQAGDNASPPTLQALCLPPLSFWTHLNSEQWVFIPAQQISPEGNSPKQCNTCQALDFCVLETNTSAKLLCN